MSEARQGVNANLTIFALLRAYMPYAAAMDIEIKAMRHARELVMEARERDVIIIGSTHDFQITPGVDYLREQEKKSALLPGCGAALLPHGSAR